MGCRVTYSDVDEAEWVERARQGDREAFDRLVTCFRPVIQAVVFGRVGIRSEAEDLVQDVLAAAWAKLPALRETAAFGGWIRMIAVNACRGWRRRSVAWPESLDDIPDLMPIVDPAAGPLEALLTRERERTWRRALDIIPAGNRIALLLHVWGGYSYEEIAGLTNTTVTTVEGRIYRAKKQLRQIIARDMPDFIVKSRHRRQESEP
ncbi:MAG TPA: RNA polymerase sigma factor [Armatimonadota bacterium]|nr:RNA polymerase sigma factor [Armatimonadota bacterium]